MHAIRPLPSFFATFRPPTRPSGPGPSLPHWVIAAVLLAPLVLLGAALLPLLDREDGR